MGGKIFAVLFSGIFVIVGLGVTGFGFKQMAAAKRSLDWHTTQGTIISSEMGTHSDSDSGTTYSADVMYDYHVDGELLSGGRVRFGQVSTSNPGDARRILNRYKKGIPVTVYYDPADPYESVLEPGMSNSIWFLPAFGLVFALFGGFFMTGVLLGKTS